MYCKINQIIKQYKNQPKNSHHLLKFINKKQIIILNLSIVKQNK
jgi:hypothetical protein